MTNGHQNDARLSPDYGGRLGYGIFHFLLRFAGIRPAYVLLAFVIPYYVLFRPSARRAARPYLKRRFPLAGPWRMLWHTLRHFYTFGLVLIDQAAMGILGPEKFQVSFPGEQELYRRVQQGKGAILLTSHVGNWQTAMANMPALDKPISFQFRLEAHTQGRHFFDLAGKENLFRMVNPDGFLGGMVELTNALRRGECVSIMGDRAWGARVREAPFLGEKAAFPEAGHHLACATNAHLVMLLTKRTGKLRYAIEAHYLTDAPEPPLDRNEKIAFLLYNYVEVLEGYLAKNPYMWFNFFDFWSKEKKN